MKVHACQQDGTPRDAFCPWTVFPPWKALSCRWPCRGCRPLLKACGRGSAKPRTFPERPGGDVQQIQEETRWHGKGTVGLENTSLKKEGVVRPFVICSRDKGPLRAAQGPGHGVGISGELLHECWAWPRGPPPWTLPLLESLCPCVCVSCPSLEIPVLDLPLPGCLPEPLCAQVSLLVFSGGSSPGVPVPGPLLPLLASLRSEVVLQGTAPSWAPQSSLPAPASCAAPGADFSGSPGHACLWPAGTHVHLLSSYLGVGVMWQ